MDVPFSLDAALWKGDGYQLHFLPSTKHKRGNESLGLFYLTVPSSILKPGEAATIKMTSNKGTPGWFNLYPYTDVVARQRKLQ